ncbi:MAG: aminotransferase class III-fold pyridoxal phosphate-dependent enzyme, partial [Armatimonadetes bacterium]|nr:aminotransferase class III-fold pyridoxal phosphate-dependent enzyme [Armatimonadota bacterium]
RIQDIDGRWYIDYRSALGPIILGYRHPVVDAAVRAQLDKGVLFSMASPLELDVAELLTRLVPGLEQVRFMKTGNDANSAAVRLLQLTQDEIEDLATEIIFGQLRLTVASLTIEQINQDREKFLDAIRSNIDPELRKVGLYLINVNITDITDDSGYIDAIGKKAAATAINQARVDVAEQERKGSVGEADAHREQRIKVAEYNASAVEGENTSQAQIAAYNADLGEKEAEAKRRSEVARQEAEAKIQMVRAEAEQRRLEADEIVQREIDKRMITIAAEAEAEKRRREAAGEADAILSIRTAEAEGIQKILDAKAEGYRRLVIACAGSAREAATMLLVEKLEVIVQLQTEAIKNIKIDKVTVWDTGNSEKGSSTANFLSSMVKSLPALHDIAEMAGVDLPAYLGRVRNDEPGERTAAVSVPEPSGPPPAPTPGTGDGEDS